MTARAACWGDAREELIGKHATDIVVPDEQPNIAPAIDRYQGP
ncbi:hypothetical protein PEC18_30300 [Paucibacter sp. O1-1]|nr:hypothetical protein [Paucibacter sp. O1-1]MDA3830009.1 hypothetical protein [Paucibacter sp. O1-1]